MKIGLEFSIDKIEEKLARDPKTLLEYRIRAAAGDLGRGIVERFPFVKVMGKSWPEGRPVLDDPYPAHMRPQDYYRCEIIVLAMPDMRKLENAIRNIMLDVAVRRYGPDQGAAEVLQAIEHYCQFDAPPTH